MKEFWFCFVPLFVAMDAIGLLPIYLNLTEGMSRTEQRRTLRQSVLTALMAKS
jgi:multiple antibiotic resistance protein